MNIPTNPEASEIEKFPHVQKRICMLWGTQELDGHINHLLTDSRDGQRSGFPIEVTAELLFLAELNKLIRAIDLSRKLKIPLREAYQKIDKKDRGADLGDPTDPLSGRDSFAREAQELGVRPRPVRKAEESDGFLATIGKGVFSLFTNKAVLFLVVLLLAYQYILPLFMK
ncbi:MAG: hypothetical protein AB1443_13855 [Pseudomonadota bacterium]